MGQVFKTLSQGIYFSRNHFNSSIKVEYLSIFVLWLFTISSLIGISFGYTEWFISKTPINLMLGFLLVLINLPFDKKYSKAAFLMFFLFGMTLEVVGVWRGDVFGIYHYGENLGTKLLGVPLIIGIYWAVLTVVTSQISRMFFNKWYVIAIIGASMMVGLDFFMEQMAHPFDYWHFPEGVAPFQNYIVWFLASFVLQLFAIRYFNNGGGRFSSHLFLSQLVFFQITYIILVV